MQSPDINTDIPTPSEAKDIQWTFANLFYQRWSCVYLSLNKTDFLNKTTGHNRSAESFSLISKNTQNIKVKVTLNVQFQ